MKQIYQPMHVNKIAIIGLGYVGLPLAVGLEKHFDVIGFDVDPERIQELINGYDRTREVTSADLKALKRLSFSTDPNVMADVDFYIVTVPTPIDNMNTPDVSILRTASATIAKTLKPTNTVFYESTVYPGATEEICIPVLEEQSGLVLNKDFFVGYSPERINPGDKENTLNTITKLVSGSTPETTALGVSVYSKVVSAEIFPVKSIKVAEAAKVIENIQRDVNIALINEFSVIFHAIGIDTAEVLEAAATKWNFMKFSPGLVGGHCIGVDPHYLAHKAMSIGVDPDIILAARKRSEKMGAYIAEQLLRRLVARKTNFKDLRILVMGYTFKENCPDTRNSRVVDIIDHLKHYDIQMDVYDPVVDATEAKALNLTQTVPAAGVYDAVVVAVAHTEFKTLGVERIAGFTKNSNGLLFDIKGVFPLNKTDFRL